MTASTVCLSFRVHACRGCLALRGFESTSDCSRGAAAWGCTGLGCRCGSRGFSAAHGANVARWSGRVCHSASSPSTQSVIFEIVSREIVVAYTSATSASTSPVVSSFAVSDDDIESTPSIPLRTVCGSRLPSRSASALQARRRLPCGTRRVRASLRATCRGLLGHGPVQGLECSSARLGFVVGSLEPQVEGFQASEDEAGFVLEGVVVGEGPSLDALGEDL